MIRPVSSAGASPTPPARQREVVEQLQRDGVEFRGTRSLLGIPTPLTKSLPAAEVVDRIGTQVVLFCLPGVAAVPLHDFAQLQEAAVFAQKLPDEHARQPALARNLRELSEKGFEFHHEGNLVQPQGAYDAVLGNQPVKATAGQLELPLDEPGAARLRQFIDTPAFRLEALGLQFFQQGNRASGLQVYDQPTVDLGHLKIAGGRLAELEALHHELGGGELKTTLEAWKTVAENSPREALVKLARWSSPQREVAMRQATASLSSPQEVFAQIPPENRNSFRGSDDRERYERGVSPVLNGLLDRLKDFPEVGPAAELAQKLGAGCRAWHRHAILSASLKYLESGGTDRVQMLLKVLPADPGQEAAEAALEALRGNPVLERLPRDAKLWPTSQWALCKMLLAPGEGAGARMLEEAYWLRDGADENFKTLAEVALQGNAVGLAMLAGLTDKRQIKSLAEVLLKAPPPETPAQIARLGARALPSSSPPACQQALIERLDPRHADLVLTECLLKDAPAVLDWAGQHASSAQTLLDLRSSLEVKDTFREMDERDRAQTQRVGSQRAVLQAMTRFQATRAAASFALALTEGAPSAKTYLALQAALAGAEARTPGELAALAGQMLQLDPRPESAHAALKLLEAHPELQASIAEIRSLTEGLTAGGPAAVASVWLAEGPARDPAHFATLGSQALSRLNSQFWREREGDEDVLPARLLTRATTSPAASAALSLLPGVQRKLDLARDVLAVSSARTAQELAPALLKHVSDTDAAVAQLQKLPGGQDNAAGWALLAQGLKTSVRHEVALFLHSHGPLERSDLDRFAETLREANRNDRRSDDDRGRMAERDLVLSRLPQVDARSEVKRLVSAERSTLVEETDAGVTVGGSRLRKRAE